MIPAPEPWWLDPKNLHVGTRLKYKGIKEFTYQVCTDPDWGEGVHVENINTGSWFRLRTEHQFDWFELEKATEKS